MRAPSFFLLAIASIGLSGCLVRAAADIVTAPVRLGSSAVDLVTTSQSEADEARGREIRRREERLGELERLYDREVAKCRDDNDSACEKARDIYAEMQQILPSIPAEPEDD
jgi:hypothetical protein